MTAMKTPSLTEAAYARIRGDILACRLRPGDKLKISDLCASLDFSLGAIREALARLTSEGLVLSEPHKGFRVTPITRGDLEDITRVRATIETQCIESAIANGGLGWETAIVSTRFELSRLPLHDPNDPARTNAAWAQTHRTFHAALVAACDSPWLLRIREMLWTQSERYRAASVPLEQTARDVAAEHDEIAEATLARDAAAASAALRAHLARTTRILIDAGVVDSARVAR